MLTNLKIGTRLAVGFGLILTLLLVIAGLGLNRMGHIAEDTDEIVTHYNRQLAYANAMSEQAYLIKKAWRFLFCAANLITYGSFVSSKSIGI